MNFFDLVNISEKNMTLLNPMYNEKIEKIGRVLDLSEDKKVLDLACGFGEVLAIWGTKYGISGTGVEIREFACNKAKERMKELNLNQIKIKCDNATNYIPKQKYDIVSVIGASFIYGGFRNSIKRMKSMINKDGRVVIGEPYLLKEPETDGAKDFVKNEGILKESELVEILRSEGYDLEYMVRSSKDEWDHYEAENWLGLNKWLESNQEHPEWNEVHTYLRESQYQYFNYGSDHMGWAIYVLRQQT